MKWFEGGIPSAIQAAKDNKSVFIVFISGEDEPSSTMESYLHQDSVTGLCERNKCVAVKLISNSNDCKSFSQIFPVVVIPSVFFIGDNGTPLEVIGECKSAEDFQVKVEGAITLQSQSLTSQPGPSSGASNTNTSSPPPPPPHPQMNQSCNQEDSENLTLEAAGAEGGMEGPQGEDVSPDKKARTEELTKEEKVERARQLVEEKRIQKMQQEAEEAKEREQQRRNVGQGVQQLRQSQKEMEMLEAKKELRKDREDDKLARQRVKEQIARDRAEKNARFSQAKEERDQAQEEARKRKLLEQQAAADAEQARRSDIARIQFRMPDGSSITNQFPATDTFASVHEFIIGHTGRGIKLSTSFPRRTFTESDHGTSLQELALAPSAVILVIPGRGNSTGVRSSSQAVGFTNLLFAPFIFLWNIVASLFGLASSSSSSSASSASPVPAAAKGGDRNMGGARQRESSMRHEAGGGIRRFHNAEDDDDEDRATWNGNSTQQM